MIKLFITDIDGCISTPFVTPDWETVTAIRELNQKSAHQPSIPPLSICSGRPFAYVEAVAQWLDISRPVVFESAGVFHPSEYRISINPVFDKEAGRKIEELKSWLKKEIIPNEEGMAAEFSKQMDAGLVHPERDVIQGVYPKIKAHVAANYQDFEVHYTDVSINIVAKANNKKRGIQDLCDLLDIDVSEAAYIGDSSGDIPGLQLVGQPFAPLNASDEVKEVARHVPHESTRAVLWAYEQIIEMNERELRSTGIM